MDKRMSGVLLAVRMGWNERTCFVQPLLPLSVIRRVDKKQQRIAQGIICHYIDRTLNNCFQTIKLLPESLSWSKLIQDTKSLWLMNLSTVVWWWWWWRWRRRWWLWWWWWWWGWLWKWWWWWGWRWRRWWWWFLLTLFQFNRIFGMHGLNGEWMPWWWIFKKSFMSYTIHGIRNWNNSPETNIIVWNIVMKL